MLLIQEGEAADKALQAASGTYGRFDEARKIINPRQQ